MALEGHGLVAEPALLAGVLNLLRLLRLHVALQVEILGGKLGLHDLPVGRVIRAGGGDGLHRGLIGLDRRIDLLHVGGQIVKFLGKRIDLILKRLSIWASSLTRWESVTQLEPQRDRP